MDETRTSQAIRRALAALCLATVAACSSDMDAAPPPPPPAPPPPPPSAPPPAPAETAVVTGSRMSANALQQSMSGMPQFQPVPGYVPENRERYSENEVASINAVADQPVSTFSVDVDTGAYANTRRFLMQGQMPPQDAVRTEELINYFRYDYPLPGRRDAPFSVTTDVAATPWNADTRLMRIGLRGYDIDYDTRPPANLVFMVDVSGSMMDQDKLPLVKSSLALLADNLGPEDTVAIVAYAGWTGVVLEPTNDAAKIKASLAALDAGGSTAGAAAMELAYATARANFNDEGINRIVMATDGDFNVGLTNQGQLEDMVERQREDGITLTVLGFGQGNYNEALMEQVADLGNGNYAYIDNAMEARKVLDQEMSSTLFTIAKDVKIQVEFNPAYVSEYRLIGYENRMLAEEDFDNDQVDAGEIGASHQVTALYEIVPAGGDGWLPERRYEANRPAEGQGAEDGEMAFVQLRYKLPDEDESKLIERPVSAELLDGARALSGDMAFVTAVAAYGQKLRGDTLLGDFSYADIRALAGRQSGYWREEFIQLTQLAESQTVAGR